MMKRLDKRVGGVHRIQLTLLLICVLSTTAFPSTNHVQTYVSRSGSIDLASDGPSNFLLAQHQEDSIRAGGADSTRQKDPSVAFLYAAVPGFFVHGAGHFYAGAKTAGWVLVAGEILSLCVITYAIGVGVGESTNGSTSSGNSDIVAIFGGALFVGTWVYDVIGAPLAVQRENQEFLQGKRPDLGLRMRAEDVRVVLVYRFR